MPSKSKAQQHLMGMAYAAKQGKKGLPPIAKKLAGQMTTKQLHDFAATKTKGLPTRARRKAGGKNGGR